MGISKPFSEIKAFYEEHGCTLLLDEKDYSNNQRQKADFICSCGRIQTGRSIRHFIHRERTLCTKCSKEISAKKYQAACGHDFEGMKQNFEKRGLELLTIKPYYYRDDCVKYKCKKCGSEYSIVIGNMTDGTGCMECKLTKTRTALWNKINEICISENLVLLTPLEDFKGRNTYIEVQCSCKDKTIFKTKVEEFLYNSKRQCNNCGREAVRGENSYRWKGGITPENERIRSSTQYHQWRDAIYERDNYTCQCCGDSSGGNLQAHHILNFSEYPDKRFDLSNGITLCKTCHNPSTKGSYHYVYGVRNNTKSQLQEYINQKREELELPPILIDDIVSESISPLLQQINNDTLFKPAFKQVS